MLHWSWTHCLGEQWVRHVPRRNIKIIFSDSLFNDPLAVTNSVLQFLTADLQQIRARGSGVGGGGESLLTPFTALPEGMSTRPKRSIKCKVPVLTSSSQGDGESRGGGGGLRGAGPA